MEIFDEVEKIIAELPPEQASHLKKWLNQFQAARRYNKMKAYAMAVQALNNFEDSKSNSSWN